MGQIFPSFPSAASSPAATGVTAAGAATGAAGTGATGNTAPAVTATTPNKTIVIRTLAGVVAAKDTNSVHAAVQDDAVNDFPGPFTIPPTIRNLRCVFTAGWTGGDVIVSGNAWGLGATTETFADPGAGGGTVVGNKAFETITGAAKTVVAGVHGGDVSIGTGDSLAASQSFAMGTATVDGVPDAGTFSSTYQTYTPASIPDGAKDYEVWTPREEAWTITVADTGHTHTGPSHTHTAGAITITDPTHFHP